MNRIVWGGTDMPLAFDLKQLQRPDLRQKRSHYGQTAGFLSDTNGQDESSELVRQLFGLANSRGRENVCPSRILIVSEDNRLLRNLDETSGELSDRVDLFAITDFAKIKEAVSHYRPNCVILDLNLLSHKNEVFSTLSEVKKRFSDLSFVVAIPAEIGRGTLGARPESYGADAIMYVDSVKAGYSLSDSIALAKGRYDNL